MGLLFLAVLVANVVILGALVLATARYVVVMRSRRTSMNKAWKAARHGPVPDGVQLPSTYFMYVLGSGGHTGELCEMIKQQFRPNPRSHRRYIITSGDSHSVNAVERLEGLIGKAFPCDKNGVSQGGSWDIVHVVRARRVHQPLYTAWYSALQSAVSIVQSLVEPPSQSLTKTKTKTTSHAAGQPALTYPNLIVTNGPGTGFIVCLVAFLLKMMYIIPTDRCSILFIETWAHVSTLSLTGKLFHYSRIADLFVVQHAPLAAKTGQRFIGDVTKYGNLLGIRKTLGQEKAKQ